MLLSPLFTFAIVWLVSWGYKEQSFKVHGLWENREYCCKSDNKSCDNNLNITEISSLLPWLRIYWNNETFLEHEWVKHGSCFGMSQYEYFKTSLEIYFNFNPTLLFLQQNITPSNTALLNRDTVQNFIRKSGWNATLVCIPSSDTKTNLLSQIQLNANYDSECDDEIIFPESF